MFIEFSAARRVLRGPGTKGISDKAFRVTLALAAASHIVWSTSGKTACILMRNNDGFVVTGDDLARLNNALDYLREA